MATVDEIFQELANHMIQGIMIHQELINYYDFLHLQGYTKSQKYHYFEQCCGYRKLYHYFIEHYDKIIEIQDVKKIHIIPNSWHRHQRKDVSSQIKQQAIETGFQEWINWEEKTKQFYEKKYQELVQIGEIAAAIFIQEYI